MGIEIITKATKTEKFVKLQYFKGIDKITIGKALDINNLIYAFTMAMEMLAKI